MTKSYSVPKSLDSLKPERTQVRKVAARWPEGDVGDSSFVIPTMR